MARTVGEDAINEHTRTTLSNQNLAMLTAPADEAILCAGPARLHSADWTGDYSGLDHEYVANEQRNNHSGWSAPNGSFSYSEASREG
jgi:hypothetical protein